MFKNIYNINVMIEGPLKYIYIYKGKRNYIFKKYITLIL